MGCLSPAIRGNEIGMIFRCPFAAIPAHGRAVPSIDLENNAALVVARLWENKLLNAIGAWAHSLADLELYFF